VEGNGESNDCEYIPEGSETKKNGWCVMMDEFDTCAKLYYDSSKPDPNPKSLLRIDNYDWDWKSGPVPDSPLPTNPTSSDLYLVDKDKSEIQVPDITKLLPPSVVRLNPADLASRFLSNSILDTYEWVFDTETPQGLKDAVNPGAKSKYEPGAIHNLRVGLIHENGLWGKLGPIAIKNLVSGQLMDTSEYQRTIKENAEIGFIYRVDF
jgi:hypothetical protein